MNLCQNMIIANGKIITPDIVFCRYNSQTHKTDIKFKTGKTYSYSYNNVIWLKDPESINPSNYKIMHRGKELYGISGIYIFGAHYWHLCFRNGSERDYERESLQITTSCLTEKASKKVFDYLKETAETVKLKAEDGTKLLSKQYEKLDFVDKEKAFSTYINPKSNPIKKLTPVIPIFPFGCNASQFNAVKNALQNQISVIQGPPGTGKTQTILNIIANLLIAGKTIQVVSNNNSATANILEKLSSPEYDMGFVVATLGNADNKARFIEEQSGIYPANIKSWTFVDVIKANFFVRLQKRSSELNELFYKQEQLALERQKFNEIEIEYKHYKLYLKSKDCDFSNIKNRKSLTTDRIIFLLHRFREYFNKGKKPSLLFKIRSCFIYGIAKWNFLKNDLSDIINYIQYIFYVTKLQELWLEIKALEKSLENCEQKRLIEEHTGLSMKYLKSVLYERYRDKSERVKFGIDELWKNPKDVQNEYPIVLSTTFSARSSLGESAEFDYLIMDEASQVDIATGALALSCANNAVIVGDDKQLPNVVTSSEKARFDDSFQKYKIDRGYSFTENSFLQSLCKVIPNVPSTLLREHYRCHPKIINFCNQKFYNGRLLIMTEDNDEDDVISVYKTVVGNHQRDRMNQRQIDVIKQEVLPVIQYTDEQVGIIAPYRNQVAAIRKNLADRAIDIATVHKFQGREKNAIIITTVDDKVTDFSDDPYLLNVAISRAKKQLSIVVSGNNQPTDSNIGDLIDYIEYNNLSIKESKINSVFDLLYMQYTECRMQFLKNHLRVSRYDSENLMYALINDVLQENDFSTLKVICHQQLNMLIRDTSLLTDDELKYLSNNATHLDFLIFNRISKKAVLAIEVDGFNYHKKGTIQSERDKKKDHILELYGIPLIRFKTNESGEREKLLKQLKGIFGEDP